MNGGHRIGDAASAAALHVEALGLLRRERRLWRLALVPFLLSSLVLLVAVAACLQFAGELYAFAAGWLPILEANAWYAWLWVAPAKLVLWVVGAGLFLALCLVVLIGAWLLASLLAAPFHDALSRRVEAIVVGGVEDRSEPGVWGVIREGRRAALEELRRLLFFLAVQIALAAAGVLVPGGQLIAPPAMALFTVLFLPLDYASYALDRRQVSFPEKRRWVLAHAPVMLGFGAAAFLSFLVPGLNLLAMPVLVVSGTLLALRVPLEGDRFR